MIRVFIHPDEFNPLNGSGSPTCFLPFYLEPDKFTFTHDINNCDLIPVMVEDPEKKTTGNNGQVFYPSDLKNIIGEKTNKLVVRMMHTHTTEEAVQGLIYERTYNFWKHIAPNFVTVNTDYNAKIYSNGKGVCYDFLWNRQKAYYYEYDKYIKGKKLLWSWEATSEMYQLNNIQEMTINDNSRKFLCSNRVTSEGILQQRPRHLYRMLFLDCLRPPEWGNALDAYYSDWLSPYGPQVLSSHEEGILEKDGSNFGGWWPVTNEYFNNTIISTYVETLVGKTFSTTITEKTLEPLLKGHFILPFGYQGMIKDIMRYGFLLPDWIDYSYDSEEDTLKRFYLFTREFLRLREEYSLEELVKLRNKDINILHHNRMIFEQRPYDSLYEKLYKRI